MFLCKSDDSPLNPETPPIHKRGLVMAPGTGSQQLALPEALPRYAGEGSTNNSGSLSTEYASFRDLGGQEKEEITATT